MQISVSLDRNDFWHYQRFIYLNTRTGRWSLLVFALVVPVVTFMLNGSAAGSSGEAAVVSLVASVVWWLVLPWVLKLSAYRSFRRVPDHFKTATVTISEPSFVWKGPLSTDTLAWPAFKQMVQDNHAFYFFVDVQRAFVVPRRAFSGPDEARYFWEAAQAYQRGSLVNGQGV